MKTYFENLSIGEKEDAFDEYTNLCEQLIGMAQSTEYINIDFLLDVLQDEYMDDMDEIEAELNAEDEVPSAYEDYYDNVISPTMRGLQ